MIDPPEIVETPAADTAFIHLVIPRQKMGEVFGPAIEEIMGAIGSQGAAPAGPVFAHHLAMSEENFDFELGVPVSKPVTPSGRVEPGRRPALKVARTTHHGDYSGLPESWGEFSEWIEQQRATEADDIWETYSLGPETSQDPEDWRTQLERPLKS